MCSPRSHVVLRSPQSRLSRRSRAFLPRRFCPCVTTFEYDSRGRRILDLPPLAPFTVTKYDNHNRSIATAQYSSSSGLTTSTDPTSTSTNRMTLSETLFDEASRAWKTIRHKIGTSGSDDGTLVARSWYDQLGQVVKVNNQGALKKTRYDRLGRVTDEFILAVDNDTAYADADDVAADIVLEQHQTRYDPVLDTVTFSATISRLKTDVSTGETTGALDTNADAEARKLTAADVKGRMMVTGYWYDRTKRQKDRCEFGTNGGATLDFTTGMGTPPARSDTALVTSTLYNIDGTVDTVTDPMAHVAKSIYDALGRRTKEIRNYDVGVNSGNPSGTDDNVTVLYTYSSGLRTALTADLPSGSTDQVTTYTYGTTKGTSAGDSKIATGHLLQKVTYPDSSGSTDVVTSAYNAQSQEMWKKDQAGTIHEFDFDTRGRKTQDRVTTLASGFDGAVRRIATTYDGLGRTELVTQVDNATVGSGTVVDEVKYTYEGWGNVSKFEQDRDSAVGASGSVNDYEVSYTYAAATTGRNTIRKTQMVLPGGDYVGYDYSAAGGSHDNEVSRVTTLFNVSRITYAQYAYNGVGQVVGTEYPEPAVMWNQYSGSGTSATFPDFDDFNRVKRSRWTKDLATDIDFYHVELTYDRNSNITSADDQVHTGFDVKYTMDDIDRLTKAEEGTLSGGSITGRTRDQEWTLTQTGNWDVNKVDLNGDGDFVDTDEEDDTRAHNTVNEITTRLSGTKTLTYDATGNLTNDGVDYKYVWDAWFRMREVRKYSNNDLIAEYRYNGLGYRIGEHADTDADGDVDGSDLWYFDAFDERWRQVARFRSSDTSPKEQFVAHQAGLDGRGGSSYIDLVACRNKDADTAWTSASDGVLEERVYYCQNWRADVSALVKADGTMLEWVKYSAYGVPFGLPNGDTDSDGDCDSNDSSQVIAWYMVSAYNVRGDIDLDGDVDSTDVSLVQTGKTYGNGVLGGIQSHRGCLGMTCTFSNDYVVRNRVLDASLGHWLSRDLLGYADSQNLYVPLQLSPLSYSDPLGLASCRPGIGHMSYSDGPFRLGVVCSLGDTDTSCQPSCNFAKLRIRLKILMNDRPCNCDRDPNRAPRDITGAPIPYNPACCNTWHGPSPTGQGATGNADSGATWTPTDHHGQSTSLPTGAGPMPPTTNPGASEHGVFPTGGNFSLSCPSRQDFCVSVQSPPNRNRPYSTRSYRITACISLYCDACDDLIASTTTTASGAINLSGMSRSILVGRPMNGCSGNPIEEVRSGSSSNEQQ